MRKSRAEVMNMKYVILAIAAGGLYAQTLTILPSTAAQGRAGAFMIRLNSPDDQSPVALQWELLIPPGIVAGKGDILAGSAAESAEKRITCAEKKGEANAKPSVFACILAGGQKRIPNGTIAVIQYRVPTSIPAGVYRPEINGALGISAQLQKMVLPKAEGAITVE